VAKLGEGLAFASELKAYDGLGFTEIQAIPPGTMFGSIDGMRRWRRDRVTNDSRPFPWA
jgi:asparagine synthase (glutamine-hydrolysing)